MDDDGYEHAITNECLELSNHQLSEDGIYKNQHTFNPYNLHMGQLTVYRYWTCMHRIRKHSRL